MPSEVASAELISQLPLAAVAVFILIGGYRGWWIYGPLHRERIAQEVERRVEATTALARWENIALENLGLAHRATDVASAAVAREKRR